MRFRATWHPECGLPMSIFKHKVGLDQENNNSLASSVLKGRKKKEYTIYIERERDYMQGATSKFTHKGANVRDRVE